MCLESRHDGSYELKMIFRFCATPSRHHTSTHRRRTSADSKKLSWWGRRRCSAATENTAGARSHQKIKRWLSPRETRASVGPTRTIWHHHGTPPDASPAPVMLVGRSDRQLRTWWCGRDAWCARRPRRCSAAVACADAVGSARAHGGCVKAWLLAGYCTAGPENHRRIILSFSKC